MTASSTEKPANFDLQRLDGSQEKFNDYEGQVLLIVNTASECGFTSQYEGLEKLHKQYHQQGLTVLGFPCDQFGQQEPGDAATIGDFCQKNYGVTFPMFSKIEVNGDQAHPLFKWLKEQAPGILGTEAIKWNFTKFLVNAQGEIINRYAPKTEPADIEADIKPLIAGISG